MNTAIRLLIMLAPATLIGIAYVGIASGVLNLGAGEKDGLLLLPFALAAMVFAISFLVSWIRRSPLRRGLKLSAWMAVIALAVFIVGFPVALTLWR